MLRIPRFDEGRTISFPAVRIQRKLRNQQKLPIHVLQTQIGLSIFIAEDPEIQHFADQPVRLGLRIRIAHPDQDQIALTNASNQLFVYGYRGFGDSLNDEFHMFLLSAAIRRLC